MVVLVVVVSVVVSTVIILVVGSLVGGMVLCGRIARLADSTALWNWSIGIRRWAPRPNSGHLPTDIFRATLIIDRFPI